MCKSDINQDCKNRENHPQWGREKYRFNFKSGQISNTEKKPVKSRNMHKFLANLKRKEKLQRKIPEFFLFLFLGEGRGERGGLKRTVSNSV